MSRDDFRERLAVAGQFSYAILGYQAGRTWTRNPIDAIGRVGRWTVGCIGLLVTGPFLYGGAVILAGWDSLIRPRRQTTRPPSVRRESLHSPEEVYIQTVGSRPSLVKIPNEIIRKPYAPPLVVSTSLVAPQVSCDVIRGVRPPETEYAQLDFSSFNDQQAKVRNQQTKVRDETQAYKRRTGSSQLLKPINPVPPLRPLRRKVSVL